MTDFNFHKLEISPGLMLRLMLEVNGMTQIEVANRIGYTTKHMSGLATNKARVTTKTAVKFDKVFPQMTAARWLELQSVRDLALAERQA